MHAEQGYIGEWVLVLAAAGGVGIAAIQIAKGRLILSSIHPSPTDLNSFSPFKPENRQAIGARVIAAASPSKLEVARVAGGADVVVDYTKDGWQKYVMHITGGRGVDVVYDPVGKIKGSCPRNRMRIPDIDGFRRRAQVYCLGRAGACCRLCGWCDRAGTHHIPVWRGLEVVLNRDLHLRFHDVSSSAPAQPRPSQEHLRCRHLLGLVHLYVDRLHGTLKEI